MDRILIIKKEEFKYASVAKHIFNIEQSWINLAGGHRLKDNLKTWIWTFNSNNADWQGCKTLKLLTLGWEFPEYS